MPEQPESDLLTTMQAVLRAVNDGREETKEALAELREAVDAGMKQAADEREAIRQAIDNDTATYHQAAALEIKVEGLSDDMRKVARALTKAGITLD